MAVTTFFVSCGKDDVKKPDEVVIPRRTLMVYLCGENSLSGSIDQNVNDILAAAPSLGENCHVLVYLDGLDVPCIYDVNSQVKAKRVQDIAPEYTYPEEMNSSDPSTLSSFLDYVHTNYPSDSYALVLGSHASAWIPSARKSFGIDNQKNTTSNYGFEMEIADLDSVCRLHGKYDFILFDACFMQSVEVAYQLRNSAKYIISSPAEIPGKGAPFDKLVPIYFAEGNGVNDIVDCYYDSYKDNSTYGLILSAVNTESLETFAKETSKYIVKYSNRLLSQDYSSCLNYFNYDRYRSKGAFPDFYDMLGVMRQTLSDEDYLAWKAYLDKTVVMNRFTAYWYSAFSGRTQVDSLQCGGISMYIPLEKYNNRNEQFADAFFATSWAKAVWNTDK